MSRLTFLRRIGRPVAIGYPVFAAVYLYFEDDAAWGGPLANAIGALLLHALLFAPLYFAPLFLKRSNLARAGAASMLLPVIAMQALLVLTAALVLRLKDGIEVWTMYLAILASLIVLVAAMAALLLRQQPLTPASSLEPPEPNAAEPNAPAQ